MTMQLKSSTSHVGAAILLLAFNAGCGDGDSDGDTDASESGGSAGKGGTANGGSAGKGGTANGGSAGKGGTASGGASSGGSAASGGSGAEGGSAMPGVPVDLGVAEDYVILAKTGISTVPTSVITGNLGVSPAAASYITGFSLTAHSTNAYSSSPQVTGRVYAADYASPTPSDLTTAIGDMELAFTAAAGRAPDVTELGAGDIGGMTLEPGVYQWGTGLLIPTDITLAGSATAVWIFQVAQDLTVSSATNVVLSGGALAKNVFWQVSGAVTLGTTAHFEGVVLTQTSVTLGTGASINGRLLAQTAVSLDGSTLVEPGE